MQNKNRFIVKSLAVIFSVLPYHQTTAQKDTIPQITFDTSLLDRDGTFTEQSLPKFLAQTYAEKKLSNEDFSKETCIKAKKMGVQGSFNTVQLFLITTTCRPSQASMYIIKEARTGIEEATKLQEITNYPGMKELLAPATPPKGFPSIALPIAYFSYTAGYGLHYIAAMPAAKGKVLCEIVTEFRNNQSAQNTERIKRAYKILGTELANFHKRFTHGDFHCFNVFYDEIGGHYTLIDNETVKKTVKGNITNSATSDDITKAFLGLFSNSEPAERKDIIKGIDLKKWFDSAFKSFIEGYLDAYPSIDQKKMLQDLKAIFNSQARYPWLAIDAAKLQELRTKHINPVFEEIQKQRFK